MLPGAPIIVAARKISKKKTTERKTMNNVKIQQISDLDLSSIRTPTRYKKCKDIRKTLRAQKAASRKLYTR